MFGYSGPWPDLSDLHPPMPIAAALKPDPKLPPMKCIRCDFINEYVGKEHLDSYGRYTCRQCKQNPYR